MAINMTLVVLMALLRLASSVDDPPNTQNEDLAVAISEMQRANYFTFIMLLHMISPMDERFQGNLTFLMPNDRMLSKVSMEEDDVAELLQRHSIPSPMLFDYLQHIPTGSIIPSAKPDYVLRIFNNGRRNFLLNNVKLITPNICTAGSAFRCHGIDGVLSTQNPTATLNNSSASCVTTLNPGPLQSPPLTTLLSPNTGSSALSGHRLLAHLCYCVVMAVLSFHCFLFE